MFRFYWVDPKGSPKYVFPNLYSIYCGAVLKLWTVSEMKCHDNLTQCKIPFIAKNECRLKASAISLDFVWHSSLHKCIYIMPTLRSYKKWKFERYCFTLQRRTSVILWILPTPLWERMTLLHRRSDIYGMPSQDTHHFSMSLMRNHSILISLWKNVRESGQQWIRTKIYLTIWWAAISRHILVHVHLHVQCVCFRCIIVFKKIFNNLKFNVFLVEFQNIFMYC